MVVGLGDGEIEHIRRLDVRHFLEHRHQLWKVVELGKPGLGPVAGALRGQLYGGDGFPKGGCPGVKVKQLFLLQQRILQILLHGIHLNHCVGDRCACGENNAPTPGQLVQIAALHIEVAGLLRFGLADTAHIPHFRKCGEVFVIMGLVYKQPVNAEFFKCNHIILPALVVQLFQFGVNGFLGAFHLFAGKIVPVALFQFTDTFEDFPLLLAQCGDLTLYTHGDFLKLRMADDDGVIVAGGDASTKPLAIFCFKVLLCRHKDVCGGIELQIL